MARRLELDDDVIVRLYVEEGLRGREIARRLGCSDGIVYARLRDAGVQPDRRARLDADEVVICWIGQWSAEVGVRSVVAEVASRGDPHGTDSVFNADLWRWTVNAAPAILRLVASLDPYLQHERRRSAAERARANARERLTLRVQ